MLQLGTRQQCPRRLRHQHRPPTSRSSAASKPANSRKIAANSPAATCSTAPRPMSVPAASMSTSTQRSCARPLTAPTRAKDPGLATRFPLDANINPVGRSRRPGPAAGRHRLRHQAWRPRLVDHPVTRPYERPQHQGLPACRFRHQRPRLQRRRLPPARSPDRPLRRQPPVATKVPASTGSSAPTGSIGKGRQHSGEFRIFHRPRWLQPAQFPQPRPPTNRPR